MVKIMPTSEGGWVNYNLGFVVVVIVVLGEGVEVPTYLRNNILVDR